VLTMAGIDDHLGIFTGLCQAAVGDIDDRTGFRSLNTLELAMTYLPADLPFSEELVARRQFAYCINQIVRRTAPVLEHDLARDLLEFTLGRSIPAPSLGPECLSLLRRVAAAIRPQRRFVDPRVETAMSAIQKRHADPVLSLGDIAQEAHVSTWHLSRLLSRHTGRGFTRCLADVRIAAAKLLLADTELSIKEIAASVGFSSTNQLDRRFKGSQRTTPLAYRRDLFAQGHASPPHDSRARLTIVSDGSYPRQDATPRRRSRSG
jgi:AraC-like DNA-binding protein